MKSEIINNMHFTFVILTIFSLHRFCHSHTHQTSCVESENLFSDLCFNPTPLTQFNATQFESTQPADGWHVEYGNDVYRFHLAEVVKGKILESEDITDDFCPKLKIVHGDNSQHADGEYFGFGNLSANFTCDGSKDFPGVLRCIFENYHGTPYSERVIVYISYATRDGTFVLVTCFQNGEVGWYSASVNNKLTTEEYNAVHDHVEALGFPHDTTVNLYKDSCP